MSTIFMNSENINTSDAYRLNTILHRGGNRGIIKPHYQTYGKILRICTKTIYRQIPSIRHGRIYGQRTNFMGLYSVCVCLGVLYPGRETF